MAGRDLPAVGETRLTTGPDLPLDHRDVMPRLAQEPGAGDTDNAGAQHEHAQLQLPLNAGVYEATHSGQVDLADPPCLACRAFYREYNLRRSSAWPSNIVWRCGHCCTTLSRGENNHEPSASKTRTRRVCRRACANSLQPAGNPCTEDSNSGPRPRPRPSSR